MSIDDYVAQFASIVDACSIVARYRLQVDRKTKEIAFISGRIDFRDGSILDVKEFIERTEKGPKNTNMRTIIARIQKQIFGMIMLLILT